MANMSYCRFENTLQALIDCQEHLFDELSEEESEIRNLLVDVCRQIADEFEED